MDSEKVTFQDVHSCTVIEHTMIDVLYILCIIYGFAGTATLVTDTLSFLLLCSQRRETKEAVGSIYSYSQYHYPSSVHNDLSMWSLLQMSNRQ